MRLSEKISPPAAVAMVVVALAILGFAIWKSVGGNRYPPPPPIASGLQSGVNPVAKPNLAPASTMPGTTLPMPGAPPANSGR